MLGVLKDPVFWVLIVVIFAAPILGYGIDETPNPWTAIGMPVGWALAILVIARTRRPGHREFRLPLIAAVVAAPLTISAIMALTSSFQIPRYLFFPTMIVMAGLFIYQVIRVAMAVNPPEEFEDLEDLPDPADRPGL